MRIAFLNPPWWDSQAEHAGQIGELRCGIRAGSRWPFTQLTNLRPGQYEFGGYSPFPFFLAFAASYAQKRLPGAIVHFRDSIALKEVYAEFFDFMLAGDYDYAIIETARHPSAQRHRFGTDRQQGRDAAGHCRVGLLR